MLFLDSFDYSEDFIGYWHTAYHKAYEAAHLRAIAEHMAQVIPAASEADVMLEQFEQLLEHVKHGSCGCAQCLDYAVIRDRLMKPFVEAATQKASAA